MEKSFARFYYIGMNILGYSEKQVGRMTLWKWKLLYQAYKDNFDTELFLTLSRQRYQDIEKEITIDDVIPF